ncbi:toprim domain-containing protein [Marinobacter sp. F3R08]|uniref:DUF7146 domain-containing protein n=1 Tax=Marinobacter sp. F3R08 TaxID=2841559 RepID=UPI001C090044|nr:toprim domain-containing protein [Marinobacter sp. F3R08]MBU2952284.1 toprim domain-containing protein [Marinobacter sp. F3R08]
MSGFYPTKEVREKARGNWVAILAAMIPEIEPALQKQGRGHVTCPMPGHVSKGKKFRVFKDVNETGGAICTCNSWNEGFNVLMDYHGWDFEETKEHIGRFLQMEKVVPRAEREQKHNQHAAQTAPEETEPAPTQSAVEYGHAIEQEAMAIFADEDLSSLAQESQPETVNEATELSKSGPELAQVSTAVAPEPQSQQQPVEEQQSPPVTIADIYKAKPWLAATAEELAEQRKRDELYQAHLVERIEKLWDHALTLDSPGAEPARAYMRNRQVSIRGLNLTHSLRFVPKLVYRDEDGNNLGDHPAIIAAIRDKDGKLVTLHRTYLTKNGKKARVPSAKKMMPVPNEKDVVGGAIRLGEPQDGVVGVAEGLETALSVYRATGQMVWSLVSCSILQGFEPPAGTKVVVHWADKDRSAAGELADAVLRERLEPRGIKVVTMLPAVPIPIRAKGVDWNDVLISQGLFGFPRKEYLMNLCRKPQGGHRHVS